MKELNEDSTGMKKLLLEYLEKDIKPIINKCPENLNSLNFIGYLFFLKNFLIHLIEEGWTDTFEKTFSRWDPNVQWSFVKEIIKEYQDPFRTPIDDVSPKINKLPETSLLVDYYNELYADNVYSIEFSNKYKYKFCINEEEYVPTINYKNFCEYKNKITNEEPENIPPCGYVNFVDWNKQSYPSKVLYFKHNFYKVPPFNALYNGDYLDFSKFKDFEKKFEDFYKEYPVVSNSYLSGYKIGDNDKEKLYLLERLYFFPEKSSFMFDALCKDLCDYYYHNKKLPNYYYELNHENVFDFIFYYRFDNDDTIYGPKNNGTEFRYYNSVLKENIRWDSQPILIFDGEESRSRFDEFKDLCNNLYYISEEKDPFYEYVEKTDKLLKKYGNTLSIENYDFGEIKKDYIDYDKCINKIQKDWNKEKKINKFYCQNVVFRAVAMVLMKKSKIQNLTAFIKFVQLLHIKCMFQCKWSDMYFFSNCKDVPKIMKELKSLRMRESDLNVCSTTS